jgi:hypothetical protein
MAQVLIRNLDRKTVDRLKARARRNGRSLEAELRLILEREARAAGRVAEPATPYMTDRDKTWAVLERMAAQSSSIVPPQRRGPVPDFEPVEIKGKPLSESVIEDRE